jgi:hypothetical protein
VLLVLWIDDRDDDRVGGHLAVHPSSMALTLRAGMPTSNVTVYS